MDSSLPMFVYEEVSLVRKYVQIFLVITLYWFVSISMVFVNKYLLSSSSLNFEAPLFITFFQCVCSFLISIMIGVLKKSKDFKPKLSLMKTVFPLSLLFVGMIVSNNLCLKYVGVAFYFVGRSLTTVFNVILTFVILRQKTSHSAILSCLVIVFGFILGVDQESLTESFSIAGIIFGVSGSLFLSLNSIYTKVILPKVDDSVWLITLYNNLNAISIFIPLIIVSGELREIFQNPITGTMQFWNLMIISGFFGFAIGFVSSLQIKVTSPLTHNISGTAKACTQTVLACIWYNDTKSFLWWLSNILVMVGSGAYTRIKQLEMASEHQKRTYLKKGDPTPLLTN